MPPFPLDTLAVLQLFCEHLIRAGSVFLAALEAGNTASDSIRAMLQASIDVAVSAPNAAGCFLITGAFGCHADTDPPQKALQGQGTH